MKTYVVTPQFLVTEELVELAGNAIDSFRSSSDVFFISVDDSGEYGLAKGAKEVLKKSDKVIKNKKNSGFAITCNNGIKWVLENEKEDCYIVVANNDIEVYKGWLEAMQEPWGMFDNVGVTGIIHCQQKEREGKHLSQLSGLTLREGGLLGDYMQDGGLLMIKKSVFEKAGLYDEQFIRGGYEDVDLFLRLRDKFGMKIIMSDKAQYWHKEGATRWNSEKIGAVNNFGLESKSIENENLVKFISKWGFNPHISSPWRSIEIRNG